MTVEHDADLLVDHALRYADAGLPVFPVRPTDKTPLTSQKHATTDPDVIARWWHEWPGALIGHRVAPEHVILDIDPRHHGDATWRALKSAIALPVTRTHLSGRGDGGGHVWFLRPSGLLSVRRLDEWARMHEVGHEVAGTERWVAGIDLLQHDHRYSILPPSPHPDTGNAYKWLRGLEVAVATMPDDLASLVTDTPRPALVQPGDLGLPSLGDSIAERVNSARSWPSILEGRGWSVVSGDGESPGSIWRHPQATNPQSASIGSDGRLYVYSPNTPFEATEGQGQKHGYSKFAALALLEHGGDGKAAALAARREYAPLVTATTTSEVVDLDAERDRRRPTPIDWREFWQRERTPDDWLAEPLIPRGRSVALWASHKTGKSLLALDVAAALATGRSALGQPAKPAVTVLYVDMEMGEDDLEERLSDLGYGADDDLDRLVYFQLQQEFRGLDTIDGADHVIWLADHHRPDLIVFDTMARVVIGEENSADTYRAFYQFTGLALKARRIAVLRLDHGGKDASKGQRGSSGKGDDVDIVYRLAEEGGEQFTLTKTAGRMGWVPERVVIRREVEPLLRHVASPQPYIAGSGEVADLLALLGADADISQRAALALLKANGHKVGSRKLRDGHRAFVERMRDLS